MPLGLLTVLALLPSQVVSLSKVTSPAARKSLKETGKQLPILEAATRPSLTNADRKLVDQPPNIIFILSDDLGYGDYSISPKLAEGSLLQRGSFKLQTPNIQRLAEGGLKLTRSYSGPVCAPSRCTLMTGRHMGRCTIRGNDGSYVPLRDDDVTVAEVLKPIYNTALVGKWGLGDFGTTGYPLKQGFDHFVGQDSQLACHDWFPSTIQNGTDGKFPFNDQSTLGPDCLSQPGRCRWTNDMVREESLAFIRNNVQSAKPFFLYVSSTTPHDGMLTNFVSDGYPVPAPYTSAEFIDASWPAQLKNFAAAVWAQDSMVGAILDELKAHAGLEERTIVFFTGDNGPDMHDLTYFGDTGPFRGKKRSLHEGGIRQTVAVQWKGHVQPGSESAHVFAFWDLLPTVAELAGVPRTQWPATEGVSLAPLLTGHQEQQEGHEYLYWEYCYYGTANGILEQSYPPGWVQAIRWDDPHSTTEWKAIRVDRDRTLLYNISSDESETHDLQMQFPKISRMLGRMMEEAHVEDPHWPSVGGSSGNTRCCNACYNAQGIGCEGNCLRPGQQVKETNPELIEDATAGLRAPQVAGELLSSDRWTQQPERSQPRDGRPMESSVETQVQLLVNGSIATIAGRQGAGSCWDRGEGLFDSYAARLTVTLIGASCRHHLVGVVTRKAVPVRFDQDYVYSNVTYYIKWQTRTGEEWPMWELGAGLSQETAHDTQLRVDVQAKAQASAEKAQRHTGGAQGRGPFAAALFHPAVPPAVQAPVTAQPSVAPPLAGAPPLAATPPQAPTLAPLRSAPTPPAQSPPLAPAPASVPALTAATKAAPAALATHAQPQIVGRRQAAEAARQAAVPAKAPLPKFHVPKDGVMPPPSEWSRLFR